MYDQRRNERERGRRGEERGNCCGPAHFGCYRTELRHHAVNLLEWRRIAFVLTAHGPFWSAAGRITISKAKLQSWGAHSWNQSCEWFDELQIAKVSSFLNFKEFNLSMAQNVTQGNVQWSSDKYSEKRQRLISESMPSLVERRKILVEFIGRDLQKIVTNF